MKLIHGYVQLPIYLTADVQTNNSPPPNLFVIMSNTAIYRAAIPPAKPTRRITNQLKKPCSISAHTKLSRYVSCDILIICLYIHDSCETPTRGLFRRLKGERLARCRGADEGRAGQQRARHGAGADADGPGDGLLDTWREKPCSIRDLSAC